MGEPPLHLLSSTLERQNAHSFIGHVRVGQQIGQQPWAALSSTSHAYFLSTLTSSLDLWLGYYGAGFKEENFRGSGSGTTARTNSSYSSTHGQRLVI